MRGSPGHSSSPAGGGAAQFAPSPFPDLRVSFWSLDDAVTYVEAWKAGR